MSIDNQGIIGVAPDGDIDDNPIDDPDFNPRERERERDQGTIKPTINNKNEIGYIAPGLPEEAEILLGHLNYQKRIILNKNKKNKRLICTFQYI